MTARLVDLITASGPTGRLPVSAIVTAVSGGGPVDVTVAGATVTVPRLETYTAPAVGDVVLLLPTAASYVALARFATT